MSWDTLLPRHICWSYYYDPRCLRGSPSNLAMFCVPSVMILAIILESIPRCHLVVGILLLGFEPKIYPTYLMLIVFARSFRILVTFALALEVRGISFFQILWTTYGRSLLDQKITTDPLWVLHAILWLCQLNLSAWIIRKKYVELVRHANLCIHK